MVYSTQNQHSTRIPYVRLLIEMSAKGERFEYQTNWLSDALLNVKKLIKNSVKSAACEILGRSDSLIAIANNGKRVITDVSQSCDNSQIARPKTWKIKNQLKRCRNQKKISGKINSCTTESVRQQNATQRTNSSSQEDSDSSDSSSDLRSSSRYTNRNILSRLVQHSFYSVVNTGVTMDQGTMGSALCRSFLALYMKLDESSVYSNLLDSWDKAGQKIIVLKGYNHKHLQYLAKEVRHIAMESNTLYRTTGQTRVMLILTAFGREEDMEEAFDDLCYLH
ncbi:uncharacterized protein LOC105684591 [Athalia rosae]|uniref:uncharacterized protein LOC105684591 n=1 Tax=Athalia rosae TaxID=37344 RepID=UPI002033912F|nr:uncharacterized protein LOC105684591 [Athalia rosae]